MWTHLEGVDADIVALIHKRRDAERIECSRNQLGIRSPLKLFSRDEDAVVGVAEVL